MRRLALLVLDLLIVTLSAAAVVIAVTGGGAFGLGRLHVSARSPDNPLVLLTLLLLVRSRASRAGFLGVAHWTFDSARIRAAAFCRDFSAWNDRVDGRSAGRIVVAVTMLAAVVKAALAWAHPGFYSGDDVEIHEMTLGLLLRKQWSVWDLRSPIFPLTVVYPAQFLGSLATANVEWLVWIGRLPVALISSVSIPLVWRAARKTSGDGWAVCAAVLLATSQLHVAFGSTELPRPVSTAFVLAGFLFVARGSAAGAIAAALSLAIAGTLRFSEALFVCPALLQLTIERRWRHVPMLVSVFAVAFAGIVALSDSLYWGDAFHSLRAAVDYTFVQAGSSRGYQGTFWYAARFYTWVNPAVLVLAIIGSTRRRPETLWAWIPVVLLSALPHKESRYLIPALPFICMLAAAGAAQVASASGEASNPGSDWKPAGLVAALLLGLVFDVGHWRLPRTDADVRLAAAIAPRLPAGVTVAIEQPWRVGGQIHFAAQLVADLRPGNLDEARYLIDALATRPWVLLDSRASHYAALERELVQHRYEELRHAEPSTYRVWHPLP